MGTDQPSVTAPIPPPPSLSLRKGTPWRGVEALNNKIDALTTIVNDLRDKIADMVPSHRNKDGIPIGTEISAEVDEWGEIVLTTEQTGYRVTKMGELSIVDGTKFNSLSKAAEVVSGITRKSGWVFWKDRNTGRTLKDQYKG